MERISRSAWQLKRGDLLITAGSYGEEFDHPVEVADAVEMATDVRVSFANGMQVMVFNRNATVAIVDTFRSPDVTAETKPCADCGTPISARSIYHECRHCRKCTRPATCGYNHDQQQN